MESILTDKQEKFLELIFLPEYCNNYKAAAIEAGYSVNTPVWQIVNGLKQEILDRVELNLALHAPNASNKIVEVMNNPDSKGSKSVLDASGMILDRVGIVKKEKLEIDHKSVNGMFILPAKKEVT